MKLYCILLITLLPLLSQSYPATEEKQIALDEEVDNENAESGVDSQITKRSNSFDYVTHLKTGLLSSIGHASASIASGSSGSSSGGGGSYKSYEAHHGNSVDYDPWSFKKTVLNTIFQAVKAITGGVTALKGQLIKGSGYALSASGSLVAASGDKVTDVGKAIINSAQIHSPSYGPPGHSSGGGGYVHPFTKISSLSAASSGSSSGSKHVASPGPVVHTETITSYEIPSGHSNYGPPSKPPTYSSATHQYLPSAGAGGYPGGGGGGAPFSGGHVAFEAPQNNYVPSGYGQDGHDDFNIYPRHKKLTDNEARKAAAQLQEILGLLPNGKTEFTASKTVTLDTSGVPTGPSGDQHNADHVDLHGYGLPNDLGHLESLSHTESITAAYGQRPANQLQENPSDIYRQMAKKQSPEEIYIQKHPNEGYDYRPTRLPDHQHNANNNNNNNNNNGVNNYKYNNYHANSANNALKDLTPIIAALEVAKRSGANAPPTQTQYTVEKNVFKVQPPPPPPSPQYQGSQTQQQAPQYHVTPPQFQAATQQGPHGPHGPPPGPPQGPQYNQLPALVHKSKYTYFNPEAQNKIDYHQSVQYVPQSSYKVRRHAPAPAVATSAKMTRHKRKLPSPMFRAQDYEIQDPLLFNRLLMTM